MSKGIICDRCGKTCKTKSKLITTNTIGGIFDYWKDYNLCLDCMAEVLAWIKTKPADKPGKNNTKIT